MDPEYKFVSELFQDFEKCAEDFASFKLNIQPKIRRLIESNKEIMRTNDSYLRELMDANRGLQDKKKELYDKTVEGLKARIKRLEYRLGVLDPFIEMIQERYEIKEKEWD